MFSIGRYDHYDLLGLTSEAGEKDIQKAYRKRSLAVHPDRNPDNPEAAQMFHELKIAHDELLDPQTRSLLDAKIKSLQASAERLAKASVKRKGLLDALEESERQHKKQKTMTESERQKQEAEQNEIKEEGRRLREEREQANSKLEQEARSNAQSQDQSLFSTQVDSPIKLKYVLTNRPDLDTVPALYHILRQFGQIDESSITLTIKPPKNKPNKPPKFATAIAIFRKIEGSFGAVESSGQEARGLKDVEITWLSGEEPEPVRQLRSTGILGGRSGTSGPTTKVERTDNSSTAATAAPSASHPTSSSRDSASTKPGEGRLSGAGINFESAILMRMRQAERDRLNRGQGKAE
ncbi:hypothetical protein PIIN_08914 [Serendipita indica DSM 11827]|uniref:J domain-containing protein n=1 Tax=Serendipita indica (strain DSM 11827) TaxID=1109443 RepID=G4U362_SERID|nr:hypothetical protein PIIN_08914 [Serendipita indica DSM 11827]